MSNLKKTREAYQKVAATYAKAQLERGHLVKHIAKFSALVKQDGLVLDVGCGPGMDTAVLKQHQLNSIGLDYSLAMMQTGRHAYNRQLPFVQADMRHLPLSGKVDGIWACASMLHLDRADVLPTLQEFHRVLQVDGIVYISVKLGSGERWVNETYGQSLPRFFTFWQPETLDPLLEMAAFDIIDGWQEMGRKDMWLVRYARKRELSS